MKIKLELDPMVVAQVEDEFNLPMTDLMSVFRVGYIASFVQYGLGLDSRAEAFEKMKEYMKNNELKDLYKEIIEDLQKNGFLDRSQDLNGDAEQVRKATLENKTK